MHRTYGRICFNCASQEYDMNGLVAGNPFTLAVIPAGIQNYRIPSARRGESKLLWVFFVLSVLCCGLFFFLAGFSILKNIAGV